MTKKDATVAVDTVFEEITKTLADGGKVDLSGFGKFEVAERPARMGINSNCCIFFCHFQLFSYDFNQCFFI